jgi:nucleoside-diphosphate-sugar epimerase
MALPAAGRDAKVRRLIYAVSSSAYGNAPTLPKFEDMAPNPPPWKPPTPLPCKTESADLLILGDACRVQ